jgi:multiple sugar transport system ATP-binding protein
MDAPVLLMDEPLSNLDALLRLQARADLKRLHKEVKRTTIYVTHDQVEAMSMGDRIAVMREGSIEQLGAPMEIYDNPATQFVGGFIGSPPMNFLRFNGAVTPGSTAVKLNGCMLPVPVIDDGRAEGELALGVRPEHILFEDGSGLRGRVFGSEYLGTTQIVTVETSHGRVKARVPADVAVRTGENVGLAFRTPSLSLFDAASGQALRLRRSAEAAHG